MKYSYQLRGTNGSGKTFVANYLLNASNAVPELRTNKGKIRSYRGVFHGIPFVLLGSYETKCGGCDTISSVAEVAHLLNLYMNNVADPGVVFFEGLMISHMLGTVGKMQAQLGKARSVLAFLDTPLHECIRRVEHRRLSRGDAREFDTRNIIVDYPRVVGAKANALKQEYWVVDVPWQTACEQVSSDIQKLHGGTL